MHELPNGTCELLQLSGDLSLDLNHVSDDELDRTIANLVGPPVDGELLFRKGTRHATLLHPFFILLISNGLLVLARHTSRAASTISSPREVKTLGPERWHLIQGRYEKIAADHAKSCKYPDATPWLRLRNESGR